MTADLALDTLVRTACLLDTKLSSPSAAEAIMLAVESFGKMLKARGIQRDKRGRNPLSKRHKAALGLFEPSPIGEQTPTAQCMKAWVVRANRTKRTG
jgi:hypothetical protein